MSETSKVPLWLDVTLRVVVAALLVLTLAYKFTGARESVHIFSTLFGEHEEVMRIGTGVAELIVAILLVFECTVFLGALGAVGIMLGAINFHLFTDLGVLVVVPPMPDMPPTPGDPGLFIQAIVVLLTALALVWIHLPKRLQALLRRK